MIRRMNWKGLLIAVMAFFCFSKSYSQCGNPTISDTVRGIGCFTSANTGVIVEFVATGVPSGSNNTKWDIGDGKLYQNGSADQYYEYHKAGDYTVSFKYYLQGDTVPCPVLTQVHLVNLTAIDTIYFYTKPGASYCDTPANVTLIDSTPNVKQRYITITPSKGGGKSWDTTLYGASNTFSHIITQPGYYDVNYLDTDSPGCTYTVTKKAYLNIPSAMLADFCATIVVDSATNNNNQINLTVNYKPNTSQNDTAGQPVTYKWLFPGASNFTSWTGEFPPMITYKNVDTNTCHDATLTITTKTGTGCSNTYTKYCLIKKWYHPFTDAVCLSKVDTVVITSGIELAGRPYFVKGYNLTTNGQSTPTRIAASKFRLAFNNEGVSKLYITRNDSESGCLDSFIVNNAIQIIGPQATFKVTPYSRVLTCGPPDTIWLHTTNNNKLSGKINGTVYDWYLMDTAKNKVIDSTLNGDSLQSFIIKDSGLYSVALKTYNAKTGCRDSFFWKNYIFIATPKAHFLMSDSSTGYVCLGSTMYLVDSTVPVIHPNDPYTVVWYITAKDTGSKSIVSRLTGTKVSFTPPAWGHYIVEEAVSNGLKSACRDTLFDSAAFDVYALRGHVVLDTSGVPSCVSASSPATITAEMDTSFSLPGFASVKNDTVKYAWKVSPSAGVTFAKWTTGPLSGKKDTSSQKVSISFTQTGSYTISCSISSSAFECFYSYQQGSLFNFGTIASFSESDSTPCKWTPSAHDSVKMTNNSQLNPTIFSWSVTDSKGNPDTSAKIFPNSTVKNPTMIFTADGDYIVKLTTSKEPGSISCGSSTTHTVTVRTPSAHFNVSPQSDTFLRCALLTSPLTFVADTGNGAKSMDHIKRFIWNFGDGTIVDTTLYTVQHQYKTNDSAGYTVSLKTINANGCTNDTSRSHYIKIVGPVPRINVNSSRSCGSTEIIITNRSHDVKNYKLFFGDGTPNLDSTLNTNSDTLVKHDYVYPSSATADSEQYPLTMVTSDNNCYSLFDTTITIYKPPTAVFIKQNDSTCAPDEVFFDASSSTNVLTYTWQFGVPTTGFSTDTTKGTGVRAHHTYDSGRYIVRLIVTSSAGCVTTAQDTVHSIPHPKAAFSIANFSGSTDTICSTEAVNFLDNSSTENGAPIIQWYWNFDSTISTGAQDSGQNVSHLFPNPGFYNIKEWVVSKLGCEDTMTIDRYIDVLDTAHPVSPTLDYVTLDTSRVYLATHGSTVQVYWSNNGNHVNWKKDYLYRNNVTPGLIDSTKSLTDTSFVDMSAQADSQSYSYSLNGKNGCDLFSKFSTVHSTINVSVNKIPNFNGLQIVWTPYKGWASVGGYKLYRRGADGHYNFIKTFAPGDTSYTDPSLCDSSYEYFVAGINGLDTTMISYSNIDTGAPAYVYQTSGIYLKDVTVVNNSGIFVNWMSGVQSNINYYSVDRWTLQNGWKTNIDTTPFLFFYDATANVNSQSYIYRVNVIDKCGNISQAESNDGTSIYLTGKIVHDTRVFTWNRYQAWADNVNYYLLQVHIPSSPYWATISNQIPNIDTTYTDDSIYTPDTVSCYRVLAIGNFGGPDGGLDTSISNYACLDIPSRIWVPNAFTPNGDEINDTFKVVSVSLYSGIPTTDLQFDFRIYDRWGTNLFETHDINKGWDGKHDGINCPLGVYIWIVQAHGRDGKNFYQKGQVTLMR